MEKELKIGLFDPGMSHLHRVGLAGLYMTLRYLNDSGKSFANASWELHNDRIVLRWQCDDNLFFEELFLASFGRDSRGLIDFAAHRRLPMGDMERVFLNEALLMTYLQHNKQNKIPKGSTRNINIDFGDKTVSLTYKPFVNSYEHVQAAKHITNKKGQLNKNIQIKGWLYPGAVKRHEKVSASEIEEPPERFISLLYAPVASLYYRLSHKDKDGKFDARRSAAIVLPHIRDLEQYARSFQRYLVSPVEKLYADGLGDAGLAALVALKADEHMEDLGVTGCSVLTMGSVGWSKQQKTRSAVTNLENVGGNHLTLFDFTYKHLPNKIVIKSPDEKSADKVSTYYVATSLCRGLIADNIAAGLNWFSGFWELMCSKNQAKIVSYERGGLNQMTKEDIWPSDADKQFVEALHVAIKNRYGALANRTKPGERIPFDREFERIRTGLMRSKNAQTLRAELADILARGGINLKLQRNWAYLLPLFVGQDWQRARDLALFALASYGDRGAEEITNTDNNETEE